MRAALISVGLLLGAATLGQATDVRPITIQSLPQGRVVTGGIDPARLTNVLIDTNKVVAPVPIVQRRTSLMSYFPRIGFPRFPMFQGRSTFPTSPQPPTMTLPNPLNPAIPAPARPPNQFRTQ